MTEKTIGQQLKALREKKHLSLDDVSEALHIRALYIKSLEEDRIDQLPSQTQARGFIRLYASHLGLDPLILLDSPEVSTLSGPELEANVIVPQAPIPSEEKTPKHSKKRNEKNAEIAPSVKSDIPIQSEVLLYEKIMKEIGSELISRRKKLALSLDEVEKHTHIRRVYLDAIETGKIDDLPSTIQGRGLLSNYAEFLDLDPDPLLVRFADALQNKVRPNQGTLTDASPIQAEKHHPAWVSIKKYLTLDLVVGGALILTLFIFVFWGTAQLIKSNANPSSETTPQVASLVAGIPSSGESTSSLSSTGEGINSTSSALTQENTTHLVSPSQAATQNKFGSGSVQVNVIALQSSFVKVIADGRQIFNDRVIGGNVYQFSGTKTIELITGNAAALQVTFNGSSIGILGSMGQIADLVFTSAGVQTATPAVTGSATSTTTKIPTSTPTLTPTKPTLTPLVPTSQP
jgi:cytoskeletal protein RodZ